MQAIAISQVNKSYNGHQAVAELDLTVPRGSIFGLLGPNGAGKTTTLRMVLNIILPDSGRIEVLGEPMSEPLKSRIGYLPEERGLYAKMKVREVLVFLARIKGLERAVAARRAGELLGRLGLSEWAEKKVEELSKGMQQKVQFIAAIIHDPELLVLDEPFSGLDPVNTDLLKEMILELHRRGKTVVFSTHIMEQAERLCEHICLIDRGKKVLDGRLAEVKKGYGRDAVALEFEGEAAFLDDPQLVAEVDRYGSYAEVRLAAGRTPRDLLARALECGCPLRRYQVMEPTLHSIFLRIVGREGER